MTGKRDRGVVFLDRAAMDALDAEVKRRRRADGGRHSRASVVREAIANLSQRWQDTRDDTP